jgi:arginine-tRNA-protein transferase
VSGKATKHQGCYHMKYYYEDKFIAVGIVDLLPSGLSSVYYFY